MAKKPEHKTEVIFVIFVQLKIKLKCKQAPPTVTNKTEAIL